LFFKSAPGLPAAGFGHVAWAGVVSEPDDFEAGKVNVSVMVSPTAGLGLAPDPLIAIVDSSATGNFSAVEEASAVTFVPAGAVIEIEATVALGCLALIPAEVRLLSLPIASTRSLPSLANDESAA
jgi:hypothetical protein